MRERLREEAALARELAEDDYEQRHRERVAASADPEVAEQLLQAVPPEYQWRGLDRYWSKRGKRGYPGRGGTSCTFSSADHRGQPRTRLEKVKWNP